MACGFWTRLGKRCSFGRRGRRVPRDRSNHDDWDHRTQTAGAVARRRDDAYHRSIVVTICLILLGLTSDLLVDWLWVSAIGYLYVFWTTIGAQAGIFFAVFVATQLGRLPAVPLSRALWRERPALQQG